MLETFSYTDCSNLPHSCSVSCSNCIYPHTESAVIWPTRRLTSGLVSSEWEYPKLPYKLQNPPETRLFSLLTQESHADLLASPSHFSLFPRWFDREKFLYVACACLLNDFGTKRKILMGQLRCHLRSRRCHIFLKISKSILGQMTTYNKHDL
jgi:hypothetical protein